MNGDRSAWCFDFDSGSDLEKSWAFDGKHYPCYVFVPIQAGESSVGVLEIACGRAGALSERDLDSLELLGRFLAAVRILAPPLGKIEVPAKDADDG